MTLVIFSLITLLKQFLGVRVHTAPALRQRPPRLARDVTGQGVCSVRTRSNKGYTTIRG